MFTTTASAPSLRTPSASRRVRPASTAPSIDWIDVLGLVAPETALVEALQRVAAVRDAPAGALVLSREQPAIKLVLVASGQMALGRSTPAGTFRPSRSVSGPAWLDATSAWLHGSYLNDAVTVTDARVAELPRVALEMLMPRHPALAPALLRAQAEAMNPLTELVHDLAHKDAEGRFAAWLLRRLPAPGDEPVIALHERKRDIAAQLAITPETLSRLCAQLVRKGVIEMRGYRLRLLDVPRLASLAGAEAA